MPRCGLPRERGHEASRVRGRYIRPLFCEGRGPSVGPVFPGSFGSEATTNSRWNFSVTIHRRSLDPACEQTSSHRDCLRECATWASASGRNLPSPSRLIRKGEIKGPVAFSQRQSRFRFHRQPHLRIGAHEDGGDLSRTGHAERAVNACGMCDLIAFRPITPWVRRSHGSYADSRRNDDALFDWRWP
jgi:urocanate hydratase